MTSSVIVVGVDGSPASRTALRWALGEAARTGAHVEATTAWPREPAPGRPHRRYPARELHRIVEEVRAEVPGAPPVAEVTAVGDAASVLVGASWQADLLVVGTGGGEPVGGVATDCVRHSACPVVVIPPGLRL
ncbi:universal stress protein [Umezawaea endophytica]|uniref:universal stress protein n=1 Tax=Umezawaea endophytica TaxID=1654476 RepID=UPI0035E73BF4